MDRTAYNDILEANLNNNLQEQDDIDQQIFCISSVVLVLVVMLSILVPEVV
jgi:hypothetical protein